MNENLHDIDDLFHDAIEGQGELPPDHVWDNIDRSLDKISFADTQFRYKRLKRISLLLGIFSVAVVAFLLLKKPAQTDQARSNPRPDSTTADIHQRAAPLSPVARISKKGNGNMVNNAQAADSLAKENGSTPLPASPPSPVKTLSQAEQHLYYPDSLERLSEKNKPLSSEKRAGASYFKETHTDRWMKSPLTVKSGRTALRNSRTPSTAAPADDDAVAGRILPAGGTKASRKMQRTGKWQDHASGKNESAGNDSFRALADADQENADNNNATGNIHSDLKPGQSTAEERQVFATVSPTRSTVGPFMVTMPDHAGKPGVAMNANAPKNSIAKANRGFRFSLTPYYAPFFYFQRISNDGQHRPGGPGRNDADHIKHDENEASAGSFGIDIRVPLKKRWFLQSGIAYTTRSERVDAKNIFASPDNNGTAKYRLDLSSGFVYVLPKNGGAPAVGDSILTAGSSTHLAYLAVPLAVGYTFGKQKFNIIPSAGAVFNVLVHDKVQTSLVAGGSNEKQDIGSIQGLKKWYVQSFTGISLQYNIGKRISLSVTPAVNFALGSVNNNSSVKSYPNAFSVAAGLRFYF